MVRAKVRSSIAKRLMMRPGGSMKRFTAGRRHLLTAKPACRKRKLRCARRVHQHDSARMKRAMHA
ncbi:50S ribosomal protein L35 [Candidatus Tremblaya princeps]|uniref:Large ribosomal subunit protein bL35 n=1 Tax=Tremblaya princeps TaxID=189385 RepID=A0A143WNK6_TREPR|nr:50S ribosomal protein L35 [Candidatus Tremblaya princeps]